jgi:hypothetical protein
VDLGDPPEQALVLDLAVRALALGALGYFFCRGMAWKFPFFQVGIMVSGSPSNPAWLRPALRRIDA